MVGTEELQNPYTLVAPLQPPLPVQHPVRVPCPPATTQPAASSSGLRGYICKLSFSLPFGGNRSPIVPSLSREHSEEVTGVSLCQAARGNGGESRAGKSFPNDLLPWPPCSSAFKVYIGQALLPLIISQGRENK